MPATSNTCNVYSCPWKSCRDVQQNMQLQFDGEHSLTIDEHKLTVYCEGMHRNNPKEFITLRSDPRENYSEIYGERLRDADKCPNDGKRQIPCVDCIDYATSGVTFFKKIRIDIRRKTIIRKYIFSYVIISSNCCFRDSGYKNQFQRFDSITILEN